MLKRKFWFSGWRIGQSFGLQEEASSPTPAAPRTPGRPATVVREWWLVVLALCTIANLTAQPRITQVTNNASYSRLGLLNYGVAQGSPFAVFGTGLAAPGTQSVVSSFPIPVEMSGVAVQVSGSGTVLNAPIVYVTDKQVGAILPSRVPLGNATVSLSYQGRSSDPFTITVVRRSFGIFTLNQAGTGPAVVQNFISESTQPVTRS